MHRIMGRTVKYRPFWKLSQNRAYSSRPPKIAEKAAQPYRNTGFIQPTATTSPALSLRRLRYRSHASTNSATPTAAYTAMSQPFSR